LLQCRINCREQEMKGKDHKENSRREIENTRERERERERDAK
jgi:hypothetical protein